MKVKSIVSNVAATNIDDAKQFYGSIFGLTLVMDQRRIKTYSSGAKMTAQLSVASEGGSGTAVPDISIEVDDLDEVLKRVLAEKIQVDYGPVSEPWGVRRFCKSDPLGKLINVLEHE